MQPEPESTNVPWRHISHIIHAAFPEYTKRKKEVSIRFKRDVILFNLNWDGGSRNSYVVMRFDGASLPVPVLPPWNNHVEGATITIPDEFILICHSHSQGYDCGFTIYSPGGLSNHYLLQELQKGRKREI